MSSNSIYHCQQCDKTFNSKSALSGHMKVHAPNYEQHKQKSTEQLLKINEEVRLQYETEYYKNPKLCLHCNNIIPYGKEKEAKFCSRSCSASYTNKQRKPRTQESRLKTSITLKNNRNKKLTTKQLIKSSLNEAIKNNIPFSYIKKGNTKNVYMENTKYYIIKSMRQEIKKASEAGIRFTSIKYNNCAHCKNKFIFKMSQKYCVKCSAMYSNNQRAKYAFTFNVFDYPDIFDLQLVIAVGFYTSKDRKKRWNPEGLTRDHRISVTESIKNGYDPYYIKHPLNCELMSFNDNNRKKTKCSITYEELVKLVDEYENNKMK